MSTSLSAPLRAGLVAAVAVALLGAPTASPTASAAEAASGFAGQNGGTTGGQGGQVVRATTGTQIHRALCSRASVGTPIVIQVEGTINHANTTKVSGPGCDTQATQVELKGVSNVTLVGVGAGATFDQLGIHVRGASNIVIQNVTVKNVKKSGSPTSNGGDAISMESDVHNVWVDHVTLEASGGEDQGYDGLFDMKATTRYVTLSYSVLRNSGRGGLIGSSETDLSNSFITFHHNLYQNIDSRAPLLRGGIAHMFNNHYVSLNKSGINSRAGAKARVENNYFQQSKDPLGTFYTDAAGYWQVSGNIFDRVTWSARASDYRPAGPNVVSTTTVAIPYAFGLDPAACVPQILAAASGANKGLKVSAGSCSVTSTPTTTGPTTTRPTSTGPTTTTPAPTSTRPTSSRPTSTSSTTGPTGSGRLTCTARNDAWGGGFVTNVIVSNGGSTAVGSWKVTLTYDRSVAVTGTWGATVSGSGTTLAAVPVNYTSTVAAAGSVSFGLQGSASGTTPNPGCSVV